jgi:hypothetical protein
MTSRVCTTATALAALVMAATLTIAIGRAEAQRGPGPGPTDVPSERPFSGVSCDGALEQRQDGSDLVVKKDCTVGPGTYKFGDVYIVVGGTLRFQDATIDFWASNILVENGGSLIAGSPENPIGKANFANRLTIKLYGADQTCQDARCQSPKPGKGIACLSDQEGRCGVPKGIWESNVVNHTPVDRNQARKIADLPERDQYAGGVKDDYFYPYHPLPHDGADAAGYFGYKVLAVSYGGTLQLFGLQGATYGATGECGETSPTTSGTSWARLGVTAAKGAQSLSVDRKLKLRDGDQIVVTTTDYLPGHSELLTVDGEHACATTIKVKEALKYHHNGAKYPLADATPLDPTLRSAGAETRAAVAVLSRNIRIVSAGNTLNDEFPGAPAPESDQAGYFFGGHVIVRQGFKVVQVQGVEFYQLGQGGRLGHYPVHFHHARKTQNPPKDPQDRDLPRLPETFVKDSSIWDSMTRWIVLHGTQDVTLARNVGYLSVGHGFYLEDGTEINNTLDANLGIFARAAIANKQNPRKVPGILAARDLDTDVNSEHFPFKSDYDHPTVFWIMNGWNDFRDNMAAGAGTCGACYWLVPGYNSTISRGQRWESYASMQEGPDRAAMAPLKSFVGNFCTSAMTAFQTIAKTEPCLGVGPSTEEGFPILRHVPNPLAAPSGDIGENAVPNRDDYPSVADGGRFPTVCSGSKGAHDPHADCSSSPPRCSAGSGENCMVTVIDRFTTSFNYAPFNFAAIWLRPQWYLVTDSVITDAQGAGLTMVTGGGYSASDVIPGHWALVRKSAFVGHTQRATTEHVIDPQFPDLSTGLYPDNPYAADGGPFNPVSGLRCGMNTNHVRPGNRCVSVDDGVAFQMSNFGMYQRLFNVYDGPAFQDSNAYLDIKTRRMDDCKPFEDVPAGSGRCDPLRGFPPGEPQQSAWLAGFVQGLPKGYKNPLAPKKEEAYCYMPNAAIGWKQPNGFYYPPAFHSRKLFFRDVDVRHFVVTPLFEEGTLTPNKAEINKHYCWWSAGSTSSLFTGFAGNDRQTVLNDDDGTLTGYRGTTVINLDDFFLAPVEDLQCKSDNSSRTSPYEYVTTVIYPKCVIDKTCAAAPEKGNPHTNDGDWNRACTTEQCYGIPLWRQDQMPRGDTDPQNSARKLARSIRMMGQETAQRSTLTVNHGTYYVDTTVSKADQLKCVTNDPGKNPCAINEFKSGGTYYVFLLFAKEGTEQIYRFHVGVPPENAPDDPTQYMSIKLIQADVAPNPVRFANDSALPPGKARWFDKKTGVVEVTLKATDVVPHWADNVKAARKKKCQPQTYCTWNDTGNNGQGSCEDRSPRDATQKDAVCRWAIADLDCPEGGCVGFAFTLPAAFKTGVTLNPDPRQATKCLDPNGPFKASLESLKVDDGVCPGKREIQDDFCQQ